MSNSPEGLFCPGCGYDLRAISSNRCPECGLAIDRHRGGIIPWESRASLGYFKAFIRTMVIATFSPTGLAKATSFPLDVRSAGIFRWIVRVMVVVPVVSLFVFAVIKGGGLTEVFAINGPARGATEPFWEARFLWTVGATLWPVLPVGFVISLILATGMSHWFFMRRLEPARRNRAMAFSFYLTAPLGWIFLPCLAGAAIVYLSTLNKPDLSSTIDTVVLSLGWTISLISFAIVCAVLNSVRAVSASTQCGMARSLIVGVGVILQAVAAFALGLGLFPSIVGVFRLMIDGLIR